MLKLSHLLAPLQKHHPEIVSDFIVDYCRLADIPGDETYHNGYGSLKWALSYIAENDSKNAGLIFFNILCEGVAKKIESNTYEYGILKFHSITRYRSDLKDIDPIDLGALPVEIIGSTKIVINTTGRQLSSMIFRKIPDVGMIVSVYTGTHPSIKMRIDKRLIMSQNASLPNQLLDLLGAIHGGWIILSNGSGITIINHEPISITVDQILKTITPALI
jgi:hypothetical protein